MDMFNVAKHMHKKSDDQEEVLLRMWQSRDSDNQTQAICVRWSNDDEVCAVGCDDGVVRLYSKDGKLKDKLGYTPPSTGTGLDDVKLPTMALRWRPQKDASAPGNLLRVAGADGVIELYDAKKKMVKTTTREVDKTNNNRPNQTLAMDYSPDGMVWAAGGQDRIVRIYDENNAKAPRAELTGSLAGTRGHCNRICAVRINPDKPYMCASAGMDGTVLLWDMRLRGTEPFHQISGMDVRGEAIDFDGHYMLTGSWRPTEQLQIWDTRVGQKVETGGLAKSIRWKRPAPKHVGAPTSKNRWAAVRDVVKGSTNVYAAQFVGSGPCAGGIVAGGTGSKEVKVFSAASDPCAERKAIGAVRVESGVHGLHVNHAGDSIAIAAVDGSVWGVKMPHAVDVA